MLNVFSWWWTSPLREFSKLDMANIVAVLPICANNTDSSAGSR